MLLSRLFSVPQIITPPVLGVDISDSSVKWLAFNPPHMSERLRTYGEAPLAAGIVVSGIVENPEALGEVLRGLKNQFDGITEVHAALPEEASYVFGMSVPQNNSREQTMSVIEFEFEGRVPIAPNAAIYDYDVISKRDTEGKVEIAVVAFPKSLVESYSSAFEAADLTLASLELEARSIARAVSRSGINEPMSLLVDFGRARTGFAVLKQGVPIFTSSVEVGGETMTNALMEKLSYSEEQAQRFKDEQGLVPVDGKKSVGTDVVLSTITALGDEVARHYHFWDTRRNERGERLTPLGNVILVGGSSNLRGLADYLSSRVQAPVILGNVWQHVASFDDYIPPIDAPAAIQYATAIGLALRSIH